MKMKLFSLITLTAIFASGICFTANTAVAQVAVTQIATSGQEPVVPISVAIKGRKSITDYLLGQIDHVVIHYSGRSVVGNGWNDQYLDINTLRNLGYVHNGQFSELSSAIYGRAYTGGVVPTPDGNYEVNVQLTFYTVDNRIALQGNGYLPINADAYGNLWVGTFQPYVDIYSTFDVIKSGYVAGAKWTGKNGKWLDLGITWDGNNSVITIPSGNMENGFLLLADGSQNITGWNLDTGGTITGKQIYALLGSMNSSAVQSLNSPTNIDSMGQQFYLANGEIVGRYPLLDIVTSKAITNAISFTVPVWGASQGIAPSHIYFTPIYFNGANGGYKVGQEYEIPVNPATGAFTPNIPANCGLHMRIEFDGVTDWSELDTSGGVSFGKG